MLLFAKSRAAKSTSKWHQHVESTVGTARPAPTASHGHHLNHFPYSQLQAITKDHLGKKKRSVAEQDELLRELILAHPCEEVAFAACVQQLSAATAKDLLDGSFQVDPISSNGLEAYLQAFVAAARWQEDLGLGQDRNFALSLVPVARTVSRHGVSPAAAIGLLAAWSLGRPNNRLLLARSSALTKRVFQAVDFELNDFKTQLARGTVNQSICDRAIAYRNVFAGHGEPDEIITSCISCWRGWTSWTPNVPRLRNWATVSHESIFGCLLELEGPDLRSDGIRTGSKWQGLIQDGLLLPWLESKGFTLGPGLITGDSEQQFVNAFMDCALVSLQGNGSALLHHLIKRYDLDSHTLRSWQAAHRLLPQQFAALLILGAGFESNDLDSIVMQGLNALTGDITQAVRRPLGTEIATCVCKAVQGLVEGFPFILATEHEWIRFAARLWALRSVIASSGWLHSSLDPSLIAICKSQPHYPSLSTLQDLYNAINNGRQTNTTLQSCFEVYVQAFVLRGSVDVDETTAIPHALHSSWLYVRRDSVRDVTMRIACMDDLDRGIRLNCIKQLRQASEETVDELQSCLISMSKGDVLEIMNFTIVVGALNKSCGGDPCWRAMFISTAKSANFRIDREEFTSLGYSAYRQCVEALHDLVAGGLDLVQSTHKWLEELRSVEAAITALESETDSFAAISCILLEHQTDCRRRYLKMLQCFMEQTDKSRKLMLQELILALKSRNSTIVPQAVMAVSKVSSTGFARCEQLIDICRVDVNVAAARLAVWLQVSELEDATEAALSSLGNVMNLGLDNDLKPPSTSIEPARKDYAKRVAELVARAQQLERTRTSLRQTDPNAVSAMASELGLEIPPAGIAALTASVPQSLQGVIKEVGDDEVELSFALSKELNAMEHLAFGLKGTETLTVHLQLNSRAKFDAFCVHVRERGDGAVITHRYYKANSAPDRLYCDGTKLTRLAYIVSRNLWRVIYQQGETSLARLHEGIVAVMQSSASLCIVCGSSLGAPLHRATLCTQPACKQTYLKTPLDLRLQDVRSNGRVVDLLLTSVFAAANISNLGLLPDFPGTLNDAAKLQILLGTLPPTAGLASAPDFQTGLRGCGQRAELLMSWICTSYRGFIVPATGAYKLPNMASIHQFLVVNNPPEIEAAFAAHQHYSQRHVLFHGTSMDRLCAILAQGLKICSHTPLQRHGAASGAGIYTGREPSTALGYAAATQTNANFNSFYNSRTDFRNSMVVLGLEHAGNDGGSSSIHVVKDPTRIMLRYIFIVPPHVNAPVAQSIVPAMLSAFQSLKTAAAQRSAAGAASYWSTERCCVM